MRFSLKSWLRQRREPWTKVFYVAFKRWRADGMERVRMQFDTLSTKSVVFDVGGFEGAWAADIHAAYGSHIHIFEPHPRFAAAIVKRFEGVPEIQVHDIALGSKAGVLHLSDDGDASSSFRVSETAVEGRVVPVAQFFADNEIPGIDLMKVNIEGGEYDLLPALDQAGVLARIGLLQVQFHLFSEADIARREAIRQRLAKTHDCDWSYDFVWEQWRLRKPNV